MKPSRAISLMLLLLLATALACNFVTGEEDPTATPAEIPVVAPTEALDPTDTPAPAPTEAPQTSPTEVAPTEAPPPTEDTVHETLQLEETPYIHPGGFFEITPPQGWILDEMNGGASFAPPDDSGYINVEVTNTGLVLDGDAFTRFVDARDFNLFGDYDGYEILNQEVDQDNGFAVVEKQLLFDDIPQHITTYYNQHGQIVVSLDFWADEDVFSAYAGAYDQIVQTVSTDSLAAVEGNDSVEGLGIYDWIYTFPGPGDLFSIDVPLPWRYERDEEDAVIIDSFYAPDDHAFIQNIAYDDGVEISKSAAGAFALELLKRFYATDIRITDDQVQPDGSERLIWDSPGEAYSGISFLETRGTTFLLFSVIWDNPFEDTYSDPLTYTISTYDIP